MYMYQKLNYNFEIYLYSFKWWKSENGNLAFIEYNHQMIQNSATNSTRMCQAVALCSSFVDEKTNTVNAFSENMTEYPKKGKTSICAYIVPTVSLIVLETKTQN